MREDPTANRGVLKHQCDAQATRVARRQTTAGSDSTQPGGHGAALTESIPARSVGSSRSVAAGTGRCTRPPSELSAIHAPFSARPRLTREDVLGGREVADLLGLPVSTALEYARRGLLPGHKLGRRWIFLRDEVEAEVRARYRWGEAPGISACGRGRARCALPRASLLQSSYPAALSVLRFPPRESSAPYPSPWHRDPSSGAPIS